MRKSTFSPSRSTAENEEKSKDTFLFWLVFSRYLLPLLTGVTLFLMSCLYTVRGAIRGGDTVEISLLRLYANTFVGLHRYLGGTTTKNGNAFYAAVAIGAVIGLLFFLAALFFAIFAALTAYRALTPRKNGARSARCAILFRVAFPNRVCLYLSNLLFLVPALFPNYYSAVSARLALVGGESTFFVRLNRPLLVVGAWLLLTLVVALVLPPVERRLGLDPFAARQEKPQDEATDEKESDGGDAPDA